MLSKFCQQTDIIGQRIKIQNFVTQGNLAETVKRSIALYIVRKSVNSPTFSDFGPKLWKLESFLESFLLSPKTNLDWNDERGRASSPVEYHLFAHGRPCLSQEDLFLPIPSIIPGGKLYKEFIHFPQNASVVRFVYLTLILNGQEGAVAFAWDSLNTWEKIIGWPLLSEKQLSFLFYFFICRDFVFEHYVKHSKDQNDWYKSWYA